MKITKHAASWMLVCGSLCVALFGHAAEPVADIYQLPALPELRPGQTTTLKAAIERADVNNRSLRANRVDIEKANVKRRAAFAAIVPSLYAGVDYALVAGNASTSTPGQSFTFLNRRELSAGFEARLPLINSQRWTGIAAAAVEEDLSLLEVEQTRQMLLYIVAETYFQALLLQRLISVYQAQTGALERHVAAAKARYRAGVGDLLDVKRAQTDLVAVHEAHLKAVLAFEDVGDALALLMAAERTPRPVDSLQYLDVATQQLHRERANAAMQRWDLRITAKSLTLANMQLDAQWLQFAPTLDAAVQYAYVMQAHRIFADEAREQWLATLSLNVPLLDYTLVNQLQTRQLVLKQARLRADEQRAVAENEMDRAWRALREAEHLAATAQLKARLADEALELAQENYINGTGSALTVVDARRSSQTAHVDQETRRFELELARLACLRVQGIDIFDVL